MKKIFLASSPGCSEKLAKRQEKFISRMAANRLFSYVRVRDDDKEALRYKISIVGRKKNEE